MDFKALMKEEREAILREGLLSVKVNTKNDAKDMLLKNHDALPKAASDVSPKGEPSNRPLEEDSGVLLDPIRLQVNKPLGAYLLHCAAKSIFYVSEAISKEESVRLLQMVNKRPSSLGIEVVPETLAVWRTLTSGQWTQLKARKLQQWGRMIRGSEDVSGPPDSSLKNADAIVKEEVAASNAAAVAASKRSELPPWLASVASELVKCGIFTAEESPNHVLVNEYMPNGGILHHTDGPFYLPNVAILSLGGPMLITFRKRRVEMMESDSHTTARRQRERDEYSVLLQPNSLLVFREDLYSHYLHGIADGCFFDEIDSVTTDETDRGGGGDKGIASTVMTTTDEQKKKENRCICLNKVEAMVQSGQRVERQARTSFTFRRTAH